MAESPTVCVTGATGFVGQWLVKRLVEAGHRPLLLVRQKAWADRFDAAFPHIVTTAQVDLTDPASVPLLEGVLSEPVPLVHLAAAISKGRFAPQEEAEQLREVNISGTERVLSVLGGSLSKVIYISTVDVYGDGACLPITEATVPNPQTEYAISKLAAELVCQAFCEENGVPLIRLRLAQVYGAGDGHKKAIPVFMRRALKGAAIQLHGQGSALRNYIHVSDVVDAIVSALNLEKSGLYNLAGGEAVSILQVAEMIKEISGTRTEIGCDDSKSDGPDLLFDVEQASEAVGLQDSVTLVAGLSEQLRWLRNGEPPLVALPGGQAGKVSLSRRRGRLYFDLDGTLLNTELRYYYLYLDSLKGLNGVPLSQEKYWAMKRRQVAETELLGHSCVEGDRDGYFSHRKRMIENRDYLVFDSVHCHVHTLLESLAGDWHLSVVTHRGDRENLLWQLERLQLVSYFQEIISGGAEDQEKALMIKESDFPAAPGDWIIGDTEVDIRAAQALGIGAIGVTWGIREEAVLAAENPAHMAGDLQTLHRLLSAVI